MIGTRRIRRLRRPHGTTPDEVERAELAFYVESLRPGMTVLDVGAHVGELTLLFSRLVGDKGLVHAFEPSSETFERLRAVVEAAGRRNVVLNRLAVAESEGTRELNLYGGASYSSWSSLATRDLRDQGIAVDRVGVEEVETTTVDAYCTRRGIDYIDLLKIDAEGAEYQILLGARSTLERRQIGVCVFEFGRTTFDMGNRPAEIAAYMSACGFGIRNLVSRDPIFPGGESARTAQFAMHVASPTSRHWHR